MSSELYSPAGPGEHLQRMLQDWYYTPDVSALGRRGRVGRAAAPHCPRPA